MKFFPFVFSLFVFILISNVIGIIPYTFTVASQIIITASLALLVFFTVIVYGFYRWCWILQIVRTARHSNVYFAVNRGDRGNFVPHASNLTQRATIRQYAGWSHDAQRIRCFCGDARRHWGGGLAGRFFTTRTHSCAHRVVAVLQAYVFAILTCIYLRDALHPGH